LPTDKCLLDRHYSHKPGRARDWKRSQNGVDSIGSRSFATPKPAPNFEERPLKEHLEEYGEANREIHAEAVGRRERPHRASVAGDALNCGKRIQSLWSRFQE
jgi:hypothetical protein